MGEDTFPWGRGWGKACVTPNLWNDWKEEEPDDLRRQASIIDVTDPDEMKNYTWGANNEMEETGYWQKKIILTLRGLFMRKRWQRQTQCWIRRCRHPRA